MHRHREGVAVGGAQDGTRALLIRHRVHHHEARQSPATYARYKIRVNCVAPGLVQTPLSQFLTSKEGARKASLAVHPLGRLG